MEQKDKYANIDLTKIHEYSELPDKKSGQCDNCDGVNFKNNVGKGKFLRECLNCGMKKYI